MVSVGAPVKLWPYPAYMIYTRSTKPSLFSSYWEKSISLSTALQTSRMNGSIISYLPALVFTSVPYAFMLSGRWAITVETSNWGTNAPLLTSWKYLATLPMFFWRVASLEWLGRPLAFRYCLNIAMVVWSSCLNGWSMKSARITSALGVPVWGNRVVDPGGMAVLFMLLLFAIDALAAAKNLSLSCFPMSVISSVVRCPALCAKTPLDDILPFSSIKAI